MKQNAETNSKVGAACLAGIDVWLSGAAGYMPVCLCAWGRPMFTNTVLIMVIEWWHYDNDILRKTKLESLLKIIEIIKHCIPRNSHNCMWRGAVAV